MVSQPEGLEWYLSNDLLGTYQYVCVWGDGGTKRLGTLEIEHSVRKQIIILTVEVSKL